MATPVPHHTATPRPTPTPIYNMQIGATPLPVAIHERPPDPLWAYWVPGLGLLFGFLAMIFSGWALKRIGNQIKIANQQIEIANEQTKIANESLVLTRQSVELAQNDFNATMENLGITKEQTKLADAERALKPALSMTINHEANSMRVREGFHDFDLNVFNSGDKTAKGAVVHILWPSTGMVDRLELMDPLLRMTDELKIRGDRLRVNLGEPYNADGTNVYYIKRQITQDILPKNSVMFAHLDVHLEKGKYNVSWRIVAEDGTMFPPEKGLNHIQVTVE